MPVCLSCLHDLPEQDASNLCTVCGEALGWGGSRFAPTAGLLSLCHVCEQVGPPFQTAVAHGVYQRKLRGLIHLLKYEHIFTLAKPLGHLMADAVARQKELPSDMRVVTVPLHTLKERERGFNQTILLAEAAMRRLRCRRPDLRLEPALHSLGRQRPTENQSGLTPHQRRRNVRGAFYIRQPDQIAGRSVLLLDDIYTTGATARECTRTLLQGGAISVHVATLARSQREGVAFWDRTVPAQTGNSAGALTDL